MITNALSEHGKGLRAYRLDQSSLLFLNAWPAKELVSLRPNEASYNWPEIWDKARAVIKDLDACTESSSGRMAALKCCSIWLAISDFGLPFPPYKLNDRMMDRMLKRSEAIALGIMGKGQMIKLDNVGKLDNLSILK